MNNGKDCHEQDTPAVTPAEASIEGPPLHSSLEKAPASHSDSLVTASSTPHNHRLALENMRVHSYTPGHLMEEGRHTSELLLRLPDGKTVQDLRARLRTLVYSKPRAERSENHDYTLISGQWRVLFLLPIPLCKVL